MENSEPVDEGWRQDPGEKEYTPHAESIALYDRGISYSKKELIAGVYYSTDSASKVTVNYSCDVTYKNAAGNYVTYDSQSNPSYFTWYVDFMSGGNRATRLPAGATDSDAVLSNKGKGSFVLNQDRIKKVGYNYRIVCEFKKTETNILGEEVPITKDCYFDYCILPPKSEQFCQRKLNR